MTTARRRRGNVVLIVGVAMALIAAEHTAQLNTAQADEVFSKAEEHGVAWTNARSMEGKQRLGVRSEQREGESLLEKTSGGWGNGSGFKPSTGDRFKAKSITLTNGGNTREITGCKMAFLCRTARWTRVN